MADPSLVISINVNDQASVKIQSLSGELKGLTTSADASTASMGKLETTLASGVGLGVAIAGFSSLEQAIKGAIGTTAEWETTLNHIQSNTVMTSADIAVLNAGVMKLGSESGAPLTALASAFQHIDNITGDTAASMDILTVAQKSAVATGSDVSQVANTLANAMHEYSKDTSAAATAQERQNEITKQAADYMGTLHNAAALGNETLQQFSENSGRAVGQAANMGVSIDDVSAALVALTKHGFDAAQAQTQVSDAMIHIIAPTAAAKKSLEEVGQAAGVDLVSLFTPAGLATNGLNGTINKLAEALMAAGYSSTDATAMMEKFIPALRGGQGAAVLAGTGLKDYNDILILNQDHVRNATTLNDAYNRSLDTTAGQANIAKNNVQELTIAGFTPANSVLKDHLSIWNDWIGVLKDAATSVGWAKTEIGNVAPIHAATDAFGQLSGAIDKVVPSSADTAAALKTVRDMQAGLASATQNTSREIEEGLIPAFAKQSTGAREAAAALNADAQAMMELSGQTADLNVMTLNTAQTQKETTASLTAYNKSALTAEQADRKAALAADAKAQQDGLADSLTRLKDYNASLETSQKASAEREKADAQATAKSVLDSTLSTIASEKTAYDDRAAANKKSRQDQLADDLATAAASQTAWTVANTATQHAADESDIAWQRQVANIKAAADAGEQALNKSNLAILKDATDTANDVYAAQAAGIAADVHTFEEAQTRKLHTQEQTTAAMLSGIAEETAAREHAAQAAIADIDRVANAQIEALQGTLSQEQRANTERLAQEALSTRAGPGAGALLGQFFQARDAGEAATKAALDARAAGNAAAAAIDQAAADKQLALAQTLAAQLSAIDHTTYNEMRVYQIGIDQDTTAAKINAIKEQTTASKAGVTQQLADFKAAQADKAQSATQELNDFKWNQGQQTQAYKDEKAKQLADDKTALDGKLTSIATQAATELTRHTTALAHIAEQATTDSQTITWLAQRRKDDNTARVAAEAIAYKKRTDDINATAKLDMDAMDKATKAGDTAFAQRTKDAQAHYTAAQTASNTAYQIAITNLGLEKQANADAYKAMTGDVTNYGKSIDDLKNKWDAYKADLAGGAPMGPSGAGAAGVMETTSTMRQSAARTFSASDFTNAGQAAQSAYQGVYGGGAAQQWAKDATANSAAGKGGGIDDIIGSNDVLAKSAFFLSGGAKYDFGSGANTLCEAFVEQMEGRSDRQYSAYTGAQKRIASNAMQFTQPPPAGAEVYFGPTSDNENFGHVGISLGNGQFRSVTSSGIRDASIAGWNASSAPFLGWVPEHTPMYASGTDNHPGGWAIVGERGPEYLNMPAGSRVSPSAPSGGDIHIHMDPGSIVVQGNVLSEQSLTEAVHTGLLKKLRGMPTLGFR